MPVEVPVMPTVAQYLPRVQEAFTACETGHPAVGFGEVYVQTLHDPPGIEAKVGLTGGHILQGEARLTPRTDVPGVYLCGVATHPAGRVIALNGRNAAMVVLDDLSATARQGRGRTAGRRTATAPPPGR